MSICRSRSMEWNASFTAARLDQLVRSLPARERVLVDQSRPGKFCLEHGRRSLAARGNRTICRTWPITCEPYLKRLRRSPSRNLERSQLYAFRAGIFGC